MSTRRSISSMALAGAVVTVVALGGGAVALAADGPGSGPTPPKGDPTHSAACPAAAIQSLTTTLTDTGGMTLDVTFDRDIGPVAAAVGAPGEGVIEWGALAPVSGSPGSYTGLFIPPSGQPVTSSDSFLVVGCGGRWLASGKAGGSADTTPTTTKPPPTTKPPTTDSSACAGATITSVASALTSGGTGVNVTITVNHSLGGLSFSSYVRSNGEMVAKGAIPEVNGQPGTYQATLTSTSGAAIPSDATVVFGTCGGTANRIGGTTTVGSSTWSPLT